MPLPPPARPELLAPAGDQEAMRAAVANGADAVYFGLSQFNARYRATNFTLEKLPEVLEYLHDHCVRGYITLNTLIFSDELPKIASTVKGIAEAGADAVIVQDLGLASLIHRITPDLPIHGSTQMTLTESRGIERARALGIERVILARELSVADVEKTRQHTEMPLEVFVHGALCVAYSGQCLTSEALGGRSANRGQCAQACRLPYEMMVDGKHHDLGERAYLLSPQDLAAHELIEPLVQAGVQCFKIEGRLKGGAYVAATTQTYRRALDAALQNREYQVTRQESRDLQQSFSRGFGHGFLDGVNHQVLVEGRFPKSRGLRIGTVQQRTRRGLLVDVEDQHAKEHLKTGDGIVIDDGHPEEKEQGGRIRAIHEQGRGDRLELVFARDDINLDRVEPGSILWKTDDPAFRKRMEQSYSRDEVHHRATLTMTLAGNIDGPLSLSVQDDLGHRAKVQWDGPLQQARSQSLTKEVASEQLQRLGDTPFELTSVAFEITDPVHVPKSVLNDLRRQAVAEILNLRRKRAKSEVKQPEALTEWRSQIAHRHPVSASTAKPNLVVLARTVEQLAGILEWEPQNSLARPAMVYCDFEDVKKYNEAVSMAHQADMQIALATIRIVKPGEEGLLRQAATQGADGLLIRNLAGLEILSEAAPEAMLIGDFSLNVANELTVDLLSDWGLSRMVPSYDLNWEQLSAMMARINPSLFEVVVHHHMPMFHMEHCVYAAFLSEGKDWRDCGRPCDHHAIDLRDRVDAHFPVLVDVGCRNTVYNSLPQSAAEYIPRMLDAGAAWFRVELLRESREQVSGILDIYARAIAGMSTGRSIWKDLQAQNQLGVTRGTLQLL